MGASTRLLGATIMVHGDDHGLRLPPRVAPTSAKARCANGYVDRPLLPSENARLVEEATRLATT